jgi:hypothetical protein
MAIVKYSALVDGVRGSVGGVTFSANHYGAIARLRSIPVQPPSQLRAESRQRLSIFAIWWATVLTSAQRAAWDALGAATTWQNALGEDYNPTGQALYVRANDVMDYKAIAYTAVAPDTADEADPGFTIDYDGSKYIRITSIGTLTQPPNGILTIWASGATSPGRAAWFGPWAYLGHTYISNIPSLPWSIKNLGTTHDAGHYFCRFRVFRTQDVSPNVYKGRCTHPFFADTHFDAAP